MLVTVAVTVAVVWLAPRGARACSCRPPSPPDTALTEADAVFEARAFTMSTDGQRARYGFEVDRVWKGDVGARVEISTALHSATCGRTFQIGTQYVVYARRGSTPGMGPDQDPDSGPGQPEWTDTLCSRTRPSNSAGEDLAVLGAGHEPQPADPAPSVGGSASDGVEPPRIEAPPVEPPPTEPSRRGCAVERPHDLAGPAAWGLLWLGVAIGRRRTVRSVAHRRAPPRRVRTPLARS